MTEAGHVWIVTEQALNANNTPDGVLGLQLLYANSEKEHIRVSCFFILYFVVLCFGSPVPEHKLCHRARCDLCAT